MQSVYALDPPDTPRKGGSKAQLHCCALVNPDLGVGLLQRPKDNPALKSMHLTSYAYQQYISIEPRA
jgi:hypothetical protein